MRLLAFLLLLSCVLLVQSSEQLADPSTEFDSEFGKVRGFFQSVSGISVKTYYGIPYAQSPIEDLRFKAPQPWTKSWNEPFNATNLSAGCPQPDTYVKFQQFASTGNIDYDENCLFLNIWVPVVEKMSKPLPIIIFIHGGALLFNSASELKYFDGKGLAAAGQAIVVTFNYRLGVLGFLYGNSSLYPGNLGLLDQLEVFKWVKRNAHHLNGDPNQITVIGESAGSWSIGLHLLSNLSRDTFDVAIMMSGAPLTPLITESCESAQTKTLLLSKLLNCDSNVLDEALKCLQKVPLKQLLDAQLSNELMDYSPNSYRLAFQPVYGCNSLFLPNKPQTLFNDPNQGNRKVPLMIGILSNEGQDTWALWKQTFPSNQIVLPKNQSDFINITKLYLNYVMPNSEPSFIEEIVSHYFSKLNFTEVDFPFHIQEAKSKIQIRNRNSSSDSSIDHNAEGIMYELLSDFVFDCPSQWFARHWFSDLSKVFMYKISYESTSIGSRQFAPWCDQTRHGPCHMLDLQYVFAYPFTQPDLYSELDREMSALFIAEVMSMARLKVASWPAFHKIHSSNASFVSQTQANLNPAKGSRLVHNPHSFECQLWDHFVFDH